MLYSVAIILHWLSREVVCMCQRDCCATPSKTAAS